MRVGVELMITNISVAKSSLLPSKITHGTWMLVRVVGALLRKKCSAASRCWPSMIRYLSRGLSRLPTFSNLPSGSNPSFSGVNSSTVPGIGGWLTAVS